MATDLRDAALDLLLGGGCVGCGRPGRSLCAGCRTRLPQDARQAWPRPCPAGLVTPWAAGPYDGLVSEVLLAHKERHVAGLAGPLAGLLAEAVTAAAPAPLLLVPVPSRPGAARSRGHDPLLDVVRRCARLVGGAVVLPVLRSRGGVRDQALLSAAERADNLAGSMWCPSRVLRRWSGRVGHVVVCDDVITTGATAREAQRALVAAGLDVRAVAAVGATVRRHGAGHAKSSAPRVPPLGAVD